MTIMLYDISTIDGTEGRVVYMAMMHQDSASSEQYVTTNVIIISACKARNENSLRADSVKNQ